VVEGMSVSLVEGQVVEKHEVEDQEHSPLKMIQMKWNE
jgi:hypothetical protein